MKKGGKPFKQRDSTPMKFGVICGPCGDNQQAFIDFLKQQIPEKCGIAVSSLKFEIISGCPYISVETESMDDAKNICNIEAEFEENPVLVSLTSIKDLPNYVENFKKLIPKVVRDGHVNFSSLRNKFPRGFFFNMNYPPAASTILLHAALHAQMNGFPITSINLGENNIKNSNGFRMMKEYFPMLKEIYIGGNSVDESDVARNLPQGMIFLQEAPEEKEISPDASDADDNDSSDSTYSSENEEEDADVLAPEPPMINFVVHKTREVKSFYKMSMFPHNIGMIQEDPLYRFVKGYLDCMENRPSSYSSYYADNAVLSLLISDRMKERSYTEICPLTLYIGSGTNIKIGVHNYWSGSELHKGLEFIFPFGFKANISSITTQQIDDDIFVIEMHGCCIGREGHPIPFDRTLAVKKDRCVYFVTNDCVNLRD